FQHSGPVACPQSRVRNTAGNDDKPRILWAHAGHQRSRSLTPLHLALLGFGGFGMVSRGMGVRLWKLKNQRLHFWWLLLLLTALPAAAQNTVTVRLYSLHPQQHVKIAARTGTLRWRMCERCVVQEAAELSLRAAGGQVQIESRDGSADRVFI